MSGPVTDVQKRLFCRITAVELAYLHKLKDAGLIDFAHVEAVIAEAVVDRMRLARQLYEHAKSFGTSTDAGQRRTVSVCYYSEYHAARAVVLFNDKVDRDDHNKMPKNLERIFPGTGVGSALAAMLTARRNVDYDPYLTFDLATESATALPNTDAFLKSCETFLRAAGVNL